MKYKTRIEVDLEPVGEPTVLLIFGGFMEQATIDRPTTRSFEFDADAGPLNIEVCLLYKKDTDPDTAVIVRDVRLNGISNPKITWAGVYYPEYPEPWATNQQSLPLAIPGQTYLGWNGRWQLNVTVPVFTWIHQTIGLGWIFD